MGQKLIKMSERREQFSFFGESEKIVRLSVWMDMFVCVCDRASNQTLRKIWTQFSLQFLGAKSQSSLFMRKPAYPIKPCINGGH